MIVKPMFRQPAEVKLSKSEIATLHKAMLIAGHLETIRPDLTLAHVASQLEEAVRTLAAEAKARATPEGEK